MNMILYIDRRCLFGDTTRLCNEQRKVATIVCALLPYPATTCIQCHNIYSICISDSSQWYAVDTIHDLFDLDGRQLIFYSSSNRFGIDFAIEDSFAVCKSDFMR